MNTPTHTLRKTRRAAVIVSPERASKWTRKARPAAQAEGKPGAAGAKAWRTERKYESFCTDWYQPEEAGPGRVEEALG